MKETPRQDIVNEDGYPSDEALYRVGISTLDVDEIYEGSPFPLITPSPQTPDVVQPPQVTDSRAE